MIEAVGEVTFIPVDGVCLLHNVLIVDKLVDLTILLEPGFAGVLDLKVEVVQIVMCSLHMIIHDLDLNVDNPNVLFVVLESRRILQVYGHLVSGIEVGDLFR